MPRHKERSGEKRSGPCLTTESKRWLVRVKMQGKMLQGGFVSEDTVEDDLPLLSPCPSLRLWEPGDRQKASARGFASLPFGSFALFREHRNHP